MPKLAQHQRNAGVQGAPIQKKGSDTSPDPWPFSAAAGDCREARAAEFWRRSTAAIARREQRGARGLQPQEGRFGSLP
jgi:hypothetical protein